MTTRAELLDSVEAYAHRNDFSSLFGVFLNFVEARIAEGLRTSEMVFFSEIDTSVVSPVQGNDYALPDDFLEMKDVTVNISGGRVASLRAVGTDESARASQVTQGGVPSLYQIQDGLITLRPGPNGRVINLTYWGRLAALVNDTDTNSILDRYPALYNYGCLLEVWDWAQNTEERDKAAQRFGSEIKAINDMSWRQEFGTAPVASSGNNYSAVGSAL